MDQVYLDDGLFRSRAILTARNNTITDVNNTILQKIQGTVQTYESVNSVDQGEGLENRPNIPLKFLRAQNSSGLPPSKLQLKVGAPILLLRNLFPSEGLCNGTRLVVKALRQHYIEAD